MDAQLTSLLQTVVGEDLRSVALVDRDGAAVACAGIGETEAMPLAALVMYELRDENLTARLLGGEVLTIDLDDRHVALAVARRQLFVVAELARPSITTLQRISELRDEIAALLTSDTRLWTSARGTPGSAAPAELGRPRAKA